MTLPTAPFTNRDFAAANGMTVDAAEKWLRRRFERGEFLRERVALHDLETKRRYWTFMYSVNPEYRSAEQLVAAQDAALETKWAIQRAQIAVDTDTRYRQPGDPADRQYFSAGSFRDGRRGWAEYLAEARRMIEAGPA